MDSQTVSNWIQLITGVSVLIGLGLVVWELQQSRDAILSQLSSEYYQIRAQERSAVFGEDAANALAKACNRPADLSESELVVLDHVYGGRIAQIERMMRLRDRGGFYAGDTWKQGLPILDALFRSHAGRAYWASVASQYVAPELAVAGTEYLSSWDKLTCADETSAWMQAINESTLATKASSG
jgi:hypothetical protein